MAEKKSVKTNAQLIVEKKSSPLKIKKSYIVYFFLFLFAIGVFTLLNNLSDQNNHSNKGRVVVKEVVHEEVKVVEPVDNTAPDPILFKILDLFPWIMGIGMIVYLIGIFNRED